MRKTGADVSSARSWLTQLYKSRDADTFRANRRAPRRVREYSYRECRHFSACRKVRTTIARIWLSPIAIIPHSGWYVTFPFLFYSWYARKRGMGGGGNRKYIWRLDTVLLLKERFSCFLVMQWSHHAEGRDYTRSKIDLNNVNFWTGPVWQRKKQPWNKWANKFPPIMTFRIQHGCAQLRSRNYVMCTVVMRALKLSPRAHKILRHSRFRPHFLLRSFGSWGGTWREVDD